VAVAFADSVGVVPYRSAEQDVRKELRYGLRLPVVVETQAGTDHISAESENISLHGILLRAGAPVEQGSRVRLSVAFKAFASTAELWLTAAGKVLRVVPDTSGSFILAVGCERPFRILRTRLGKR